MTVRVELFHAPNCPRCERARILMRELAAGFGDRLDYRERDVVAALEDAARLGILATPTIVIDGRLAFTGLPAKDSLQTALQTAVEAEDRAEP